VPERARTMLSQFETRSRHYEVLSGGGHKRVPRSACIVLAAMAELLRPKDHPKPASRDHLNWTRPGKKARHRRPPGQIMLAVLVICVTSHCQRYRQRDKLLNFALQIRRNAGAIETLKMKVPLQGHYLRNVAHAVITCLIPE